MRSAVDRGGDDVGRIRVLVVDGHRIFAEALATTLAAEPDVDVSAVGTAPAAERALDRAVAEGRPYQVMLVDADLGTTPPPAGPGAVPGPAGTGTPGGVPAVPPGGGAGGQPVGSGSSAEGGSGGRGAGAGAGAGAGEAAPSPGGGGVAGLPRQRTRPVLPLQQQPASAHTQTARLPAQATGQGQSQAHPPDRTPPAGGGVPAQRRRLVGPGTSGQQGQGGQPGQTGVPGQLGQPGPVGAPGRPGASAPGGSAARTARTGAGAPGDGIALAGRIRAAYPALRVVVLAGEDDPRRAVRALQAGASGWVAKESSLGRLMAVVRGVLRDETHIPPALLTGVVRELTAARRDRTESERLVETLTPREKQVLRCMVAGMGRQAVADRLFLSPHTVRTHMQNVLGKLGVHSTLAAVALARRAGVGPAEFGQHATAGSAGASGGAPGGGAPDAGTSGGAAPSGAAGGGTPGGGSPAGGASGGAPPGGSPPGSVSAAG